MIRVAQSPFMFVILFGLMLAIVGVLLFVVEPSNKICIVRPWVLSLSFTLTVGSMMTKNYRLYKIFDNKKLQAKIIKDNVIWAYNIALCAIDITVLTLWMVSASPTVAIFPSQIDEKIAYKYCASIVAENDSGTIIENNSMLWLLIILKTVVVGFTSYLGWKVRKLPSLFNEAKYIAMCAYNLTLIGMLVIGLGVGLDDAPIATYLLRSMGILVVVVVVLSLLFVTKFVEMKAKPKMTMEQVLKDMDISSDKMGGNQVINVQAQKPEKEPEKMRERIQALQGALDMANSILSKLGYAVIEDSPTSNVHCRDAMLVE